MEKDCFCLRQKTAILRQQISVFRLKAAKSLGKYFFDEITNFTKEVYRQENRSLHESDSSIVIPRRSCF